MFAWGDDVERSSYEDSEAFEEESNCSWFSEPESVLNNWRGWRKQSSQVVPGHPPPLGRELGKVNLGPIDPDPRILSLTELAAREVASSIPFELVEVYGTPVPEPLQLRIAFWSFPDQEEDIRLYSCLANGNSDEFQKGESLFKSKSVKEPLQIGFHLSATIEPSTGKPSQNTSVTFDRKKIVSCQCSCNSAAQWCSHVVALALHRIHQFPNVRLRAPVSESLSRLERNQLQKFAQYLIAKLPEQILPVAQNILDDLLSQAQTDINTVQGAPDPTLGGEVGEQATWCLDAKNLKDNIKKILIKFCVPAPIVFSDVNCLSNSAPPSASEWCSYLRPLRGREPEGMWNLLSIVREMYRRNDRNSIPLLEIVTTQCLETAQIMVWWYNMKVALQQKSHGKHNVNSNSQVSQNACSSLCDEIVTLWKLAALNPCISPMERETLRKRLIQYHLTVVEKVQANQGTSAPSGSVKAQNGPNRSNHPTDIELFSGFKPAIEACTLNWDEYIIPGVTYGHNSHYLSPFAVFKLKQDESDTRGNSQVNSSQAVLRCEYPSRPRSGLVGAAAAAAVLVVAAAARPADEPDRGFDSQSSRDYGANSGNSGEENASDEGVVNDPPLFANSSSEDLKKTEQGRDSSGNESSPEREDPLGVPPQAPSLQVGGPEPPQQLQPGGHESEQYQVYFYDPKLPVKMISAASASGDVGSDPLGLTHIDVFRNLRPKIEDPWEVLYMRAEGIHAHGYQSEACKMAVHLAYDLLKNPPDLLMENTLAHNNPVPNPTPAQPNVGAKPKGKNKKRFSAASHQITHTASTTLAHCAFLCTVLAENHHYYHLAFQVGLFGLEMARPPASTKPMEVKLAHQESELVNLLKKIPISKAQVDIIRERAFQLKEGILRNRGEALLPLMLASYIFESLVINCEYRMDGDEMLGFEAAVAAIGLKANVSEADHPLLCEGTRRQRGDLAILLLTHYKDDPMRLAQTMDKLLDKDMNPLFKSSISPTAYYINGRGVQPPVAQPPRQLAESMANLAIRGGVRRRSGVPPPEAVATPPLPPVNGGFESWSSWENNLQANRDWSERVPHIPGVRPLEPSSSENSVVRPVLHHRAGPGSESSSSGNSSADSIDSSASSLKPQRAADRAALAAAQVTSPPLLPPPTMSKPVSLPNMSRATMPKGNRFKGGKRAYPSIPNQPSEAAAHFLFELAKTVLNKAGGSSSTSLFTQANQNIRGPHRALHMCAFQIGLFALGLSNLVTANWLSRTYSGNVSWITSQALELGSSALNFLMSTWEGHFSPTEVANLADKASKSRDTAMVRAGAELALSVCHHAGALNPNDTQRAIEQCNEQSVQMLEKACLAVEKASASGGVPPEVIFEVARHWYRLFEKQSPGGNECSEQVVIQPQMEQPMLQETLAAANLLHAAASFPQLGPPSLQVSLPFSVYSLVPGFTPTNHAAAASQFMFLAPPPPTTNGVCPGNMQLGGAQFLTNQVFPPVSGNNPPRFNLAGGPIFQVGLATAPLLPNPPPTNHLQVVHAAAAAQQQAAAAALLAQAAQPPPVQAPLSAQHHGQGPGAGNAGGQGPNGQRYLIAAYRVGMLALEHLGRKISEERPQLKFAKNPSYEEDVKWLLQIAKKLGLPYLEKFLVFVISTIVSPFLLQDLLWECASILAQTGYNQNSIQYSNVVHQIRNQPHLTQLLTRCCHM
eukprot:maker-scaffold550_size154339-snap-gene-0.21 protein:Tk11250 transcript:maker-scaffold550_size154339-snap-gene-0.21-mRNA-1 annotation:"zinc finger swim domain-containing protein 8"